MIYDYLIIGNSAAAVGAIEALRKGGDREIRICVISEEDTPPYSKPFIGHLLSGESGLDDLLYRPPSFHKDNSVDFFGGLRAVALDLRSRQVGLDGGELLGFRKLLIATGGSPIVPPIPGLSQSSHTFAVISDAMEIKEKLDKGGVSSAVVLGGGLIGMAATAALVERNVHVTIIELAPRILSSVLDEESSAIIQEILNEKQVRTIKGHTISRVEGNKRQPRVVVDNGEDIVCDLLIVAIGVRPRIELTRETEILVDRGIVVNQRMETNVSGIYAAGDCAQTYDFLRETNRVLALWPTAYIGGMVAGYNMAGHQIHSDWGTSMNSMHFFGKAILSAGIIDSGEGEGWQEITESAGDSYRKITTREGVIKGFVLVGEVEKAGLYLQMMRAKTRIKNLGESLLTEDFGLAHLPSKERKRILREAGKVAGP